MKKPQLAIASDPRLDYGLAERIARTLEQSHLHVFIAYGFMSMPAAIGDPDDETMSIMGELTLVTDGRRGWLVLTPAQYEWDAEEETRELVDGFLRGVDDPPKCVVRAVASQARLAGALDLRPPGRARALVEAEFERHFDGCPTVDLDPLLVAIRACSWSLNDELEIRRTMNQSPSIAPQVESA